MKLLICGDSFSYDHKHEQSWVTRLSSKFDTTNLSQCGCGEYKIKLQLESIDLAAFDAVMIFHTSPNRLYINRPNAVSQYPSHANSDFLFADVEDKKSQSTLARVAYEYFVNIFDSDYSNYVHNLILADIDQSTKSCRPLHFTAFDYSNLYDFGGQLTSFYQEFCDHRGQINHLDTQGNDIVLQCVTTQLENHLQCKLT